MTLTIRQLDPAATPEGLTPQTDLRGIAIHWKASPDAQASGSVCDSEQFPVSAPWSVQRIAFHAVSPSGDGTPPKDADEQQRYVRAAYAIAAQHHPIPSVAEIYYEVRW